ncbi:MAG: T9SS type A sorting domain-containing protein [Bacteroidales bacterium]|nr:T9SS type A sorting domain-containing protein [Bacteroidales bacterium]
MRKTSLLLFALSLFTFIQAQVTVKIGNTIEADPGTIIHVPISVTGVDASTAGIPITAMELHISYTSSYLTYDSTLNFNTLVPVEQWFYGITEVEYSTNWIEPGLNPLSIPDNTILFEISFLYLGGTTTLEFIPEKCEFLDNAYNKIEGVQFINGQVTPSSGSGISRWNGVGSWNTAANWSNGIPGEGTVALLETGTLMVESNAVCKALTVSNNTQLNVLPGFSLTIDSTFNNEGNFLISSNETGTGSLIVNREMIGSGSFQADQFMDFGVGRKYLISSPVESVTAGTLAGVGTEEYLENGGNWTPLNTNTQLITGTGYRASGSGEVTLNFSGDFAVNNKVITNLDFSNPLAGKMKGMNLIGNPFPSAIAWNQGDWVKNNLDYSIYAWNGYKYVCWNGQIGSFTDGVIPSMQGFFVRCNSQNAALTIPANSKLHSNLPYQKSIESVENLFTVKIEKQSDPDHFDETFVNINSQASNNFDAQFDAFKFFGEDQYPQVYTLSSDNNELAINTQPSYQSLPLIFKLSVPGTYKISFGGLGSFLPDQGFTLEDKVESSFMNIRTSDSYIFVSDGITEPGRFVIHFYEVGMEELSSIPLRVFMDKDQLQIYSDEGLQQIDQIRIYDVSGIQRLSKSNYQVNESLNVDFLNPGIYLAQIVIGNKMKSYKLLKTQ